MQTNEKRRWQAFVIAAAAILGVIIAFCLFMRDNYKRAEEISISSLQDSAAIYTDRLDEILERSCNEMKLAAELYEVMMEDDEVTVDDLAMLAEASPFDRIEYIDADGVRLGMNGSLMDVSEKVCYIDGISGGTGIDVSFHTEDEGGNLVLIYTPLHYGGKILGVLTGVYSEDQVDGIISNTFFGEDSRTFLCLRDGTCIGSCNGDYRSESLFDENNFNGSLGETVREELRSALASGDDYEFSYTGTSGMGSAYVTGLDSVEWMLVQTYPSQVTSRLIGSANRAGVILLISLVVIFALYLTAVIISDYLRRKRLVLANRDKSYVINGITGLYRMFVHVDLKEGRYRYLEGTKPRVPDFPTEGDYESFREYIAGMAADDDEKPHLLDWLSVQSIRHNMDNDTNYLRYEYSCTPDGEKWDSVSLICLERSDGFPSELLVTCQDVSKAKERERKSYEALKEAYVAVENANKAKSSFLSNMSHDIRTPMNAIMGMTAIAAMNTDNPERVKDCLNKITVSGQHLLGLINEVLDMSKIESGKMVLTEEEFSISDTVENVVTMFLPQAEARNQHFHVNTADVTHEEVIGDSMRLQQVFVNILGNAVKFTPDGGTITFGIYEKSSGMRGCGCYIFTFEDTGIGMDESFMDKLFEPFVRADNTRTGKTEGTGLGMPIVKNIVGMMNGDIKVESTPGKGSKFTVTVYLKLNRSKHDDVEGLENLAVLVADDDKFACESACAMLSDIGMSAEWVQSGKEALDKLKAAVEIHREYAVVILDWKMPDMNGIETAREIRRTIGEDIPIIILSAFDYSAVEQEAREAGVNAFISKPMFRSRLVYVMKSLILGEEDDEFTPAEALRHKDYSGKRILVAEDNELNMEIATELLTQTGAEVDHASNGREASEKVKASPAGYYDLVFMDIQMPEMNGYEAAAAIRASEREDLQKLPIVAMSADVFMDDVKHAHDVGMNGHVAKPVSIDNLLAALDKWIGES
jgi:signal transduction histidine kinase/DNA-binding response OmpR family regulator